MKFYGSGAPTPERRASLRAALPGATFGMQGAVWWFDAADTSETRAAAIDAGLTLDVAPKALAHGADAANLPQWDPDKAYPRLHRIDDVGAYGFVAREMWYRVEDVDFGLTDAPKANTTPVVAYEYPVWTVADFPTGMRGIQSRARDRVWWDEDGNEALRLSDASPKPYSVSTSIAAGQDRRRNVAKGTSRSPARLGLIATVALSKAHPGEDPGPYVDALSVGFAVQVEQYIQNGEQLNAALALTSTLVAHPWLGTDISAELGLPAGTTAQAAMVAETAALGVGSYGFGA